MIMDMFSVFQAIDIYSEKMWYYVVTDKPFWLVDMMSICLLFNSIFYQLQFTKIWWITLPFD